MFKWLSSFWFDSSKGSVNEEDGIMIDGYSREWMIIEIMMVLVAEKKVENERKFSSWLPSRLVIFQNCSAENPPIKWP